MIIQEDGSIEGETFTQRDPGRSIPEPDPKKGESYRAYKDRIDLLVKDGFHLGDLSWANYRNYCDGGGQTDRDVDIDEPIGIIREKAKKEQKEAQEIERRNENSDRLRREEEAEWEELYG